MYVPCALKQRLFGTPTVANTLVHNLASRELETLMVPLIPNGLMHSKPTILYLCRRELSQRQTMITTHHVLTILPSGCLTQTLMLSGRFNAFSASALVSGNTKLSDHRLRSTFSNVVETEGSSDAK